MANKFGKGYGDYAHLRNARTEEERDRRMQGIRDHILALNSEDEAFMRNAQLSDDGRLVPDRWDINFGGNAVDKRANLSTLGSIPLSINTMEMFANEAVDELVRMARPLESLVPIRRVPPNTRRVGWNVIKQQGEPGPVDDFFSNLSNVSFDQDDRHILIRLYGIAEAYATYTRDSLRLANAGITALEAELSRAATRLNLVYRERLFWFGDKKLGGDFKRGILNYPTTGTDKMPTSNLGKNATGTYGGTNEFADAEAERKAWTALIASLVNDTHGALGYQVGGVLNIAVPAWYRTHLFDTYRSDYSDDKVGRVIEMDNDWNDAAPGNSTNIFTPYLNEMDTMGANSGGIAQIWINNGDVCDMCEASPPMPYAPLPEHRGVKIPNVGQISAFNMRQPLGTKRVPLKPHS